MLKRRIAFSAALVSLAGCTVGPNYRAPNVPLPADYQSPHSQAAVTDTAEWWRAFRDPVLDDLVSRALTGNYDVRQAAARVRQAREQQLSVRRSNGPQVNASAQAGYSRLSGNALPSALANLGGGGGASAGGPGIGLAGEDFASFQTGLDASWELDLFGGQRRAEEAAAARSEAALWSRRDAEVTLTAEVANTYQQYRVLQRRIALADRNLVSERELLDFVKVRVDKGLVTTLDTRQQEREIDQQEAQRTDLKAQADARLHALGTLLGLQPKALAEQLSAPPAAPAAMVEVPAGLPSELLQRRPDLRAAERRLAAATADIGVATAELYPRFSLTGALQLASRSLGNLLESDSIQANGAGRLSLPLLGRGAKKADVRVRDAQADEAMLAYRGTVLIALRDVEDALTRLAADRRRATSLRASADASEDAAETTAVRYRSGLVTFLEVLEARQALLSARDAQAQAEAAGAQDVVALYKALGGGWDERRMPAEEEAAHGRSN